MTKTYKVNTPFFTYNTTSGGGFVLAALILLPAAFVLGIGAVMLLFGIVHGFWPAIPALGFWQTFGVYVLAQVLTHKASSSK